MKIVATFQERGEDDQYKDPFEKEFPNETQMNDWWIEQTKYAPNSLLLKSFEIIKN